MQEKVERDRDPDTLLCRRFAFGSQNEQCTLTPNDTLKVFRVSHVAVKIQTTGSCCCTGGLLADILESCTELGLTLCHGLEDDLLLRTRFTTLKENIRISRPGLETVVMAARNNFRHCALLSSARPVAYSASCVLPCLQQPSVHRDA